VGVRADLRQRDGLQQPAQNGLDRDAVGQRVVGQHQPVPEHVRGDVDDVLRNDEIAPGTDGTDVLSAQIDSPADPNSKPVAGLTSPVMIAGGGGHTCALKADKTVEMRPVTIARTHGDESIVGTGIKAGETIVVDGQLRLVPGSRVSIKS